MPKLTKTLIDNAVAGEVPLVLHDSVVPGLSVRVYPSGRKSFVYYYRARLHGPRSGGRRRERRPKLGEVGALTLEDARAAARAIATEVANGRDPVAEARRTSLTLRDFAPIYAERHGARKKPRSNQADGVLWRRHILPILGDRPMARLTRADVDELRDRLAAQPVTANRALALLSKAFNLAMTWGLVAEGPNPVRFVEKFKERRRERLPSPLEAAALGRVLEAWERDERPERRRVAAVVRLLIVTGARVREITHAPLAALQARGDGFVLELEDSKTGPKLAYLPPAAHAVLVALAVLRPRGNPWLVACGETGHLDHPRAGWKAICAEAGLHNLHLHDLRHWFVSVGVESGASLDQIGALLDHASPSTTARYRHQTPELLRVAEDVATRIDRLLAGSDLGNVRVLGR